MRKTSPDAWVFVLFVVAVIAIPIIVGMLLVKGYRKFKPFEEPQASANAIAAIDNVKHDSFFKVLIVGWLVCGPIFYFIYTSRLAMA